MPQPNLEHVSELHGCSGFPTVLLVSDRLATANGQHFTEHLLVYFQRNGGYMTIRKT